MIPIPIKQNLKTKHSNVQWNVFKGMYFYWEKSTPQFECAMECLQRSVFLLGKKHSPIQNNCSQGSTFFHVGVNFSQQNITPGVLFFRVIITPGVIFFGE